MPTLDEMLGAVEPLPPMGDGEGEDPELEEDDEGDDFSMHAETVLDPGRPMEERIEALRKAIKSA